MIVTATDLTPCKYYINGKLVMSRRYDLDAIERDWAAGGVCPLTPPGETDVRNAYRIERHAGGLRVHTTSGTWLEWVIEDDILMRIER
jgi:hypothetical protein